MAGARETAKLLREALSRLQKANPLTSIRSIALQLDVTPSYLSKIFRGERPLSTTLLGGLAKALQLDHLEIAELQRALLQKFDADTLASQTGLRALETPSEPATKNYTSLGKADFWLLEDWFTLPLLNLVTTSNFESSLCSVAKRLGISQKQAETNLDRLTQSGYLTKDADHRYHRSDLKIRFPTQRSHAAVRAYHERMVLKAVEVIRKTPSEEQFAERLISGAAFACDPSKVKEAKVILEEALYKAANLLASGDCTEVFQLNVQLFKLTKD